MRNIHEERTTKDKYFSYKKMEKRYQIAKRFAKGKVLDIGCGNAYQSLLFENYTGIDSYDKAIIFANSKYPNKKFVQMEVPPIDFKNNEFDYVICCEMIEHLEEDKAKQLVEEIKRILNKDGFLFLTTPNASNKKPEENHIKEYTREELMVLLGPNKELIYEGGMSISFNKYCPNFLKKFSQIRKIIGKFLDYTIRPLLLNYGEKNPTKAEHQVIVCKFKKEE